MAHLGFHTPLSNGQWASKFMLKNSCFITLRVEILADKKFGEDKRLQN